MGWGWKDIVNIATGGLTGAVEHAAEGDWAGVGLDVLTGAGNGLYEHAGEHEVETTPENQGISTSKYDEEILDDLAKEYGMDRETLEKYMSEIDTSGDDWKSVKMGLRDEDDRNYTEKMTDAIKAKIQAYNDSKGAAAQEISDESNAAQATQIAAAQEAQNTQTQAPNAGLNKSRAGLLGAQTATADSGNTYNNAYTALRGQSASTQADYLQKMAQTTALENQAQNMENSMKWNVAAGALQGAGSGAAMGATISDENMKESPDFDNKLNEAINKFKTLYKELQELKERK